MPTPNHPVPAAVSGPPDRVPLRLRMSGHTGRDQLDGGWWPQSRDLAVELRDLVDHFPPQRGRVARVLVSPPDWEPATRRIAVNGGYVKVGSFPRDDTHLIHLRLLNGNVLRLLVVPPSFTGDQGDEALLASATRGNAHPATDLLATVTEHPDVDPRDHWTD